MFAAPDPVASGKDYEVVAVHGRTPQALTDFVGDTVFTVRCQDEDRLVAGLGNGDGEVVRFTEKDTEHGKDVRVWVIGAARHPGRFTARTR